MADVEIEVRDLYGRYRGVLPDAYRWEDEKDRWTELVFCLFLELSGKDDAACRRVVSCLSDLSLLEAEELAELVTQQGLDLTNDAVGRLLDCLVRNGIERGAAEQTLLGVCEAAKGIQAKHGKLQYFLRLYGNKMLDDLEATIAFSQVSKDTGRRILTTWLQNVLELPIPLEDRYVESFCKEKRCTVQELVETADLWT